MREKYIEQTFRRKVLQRGGLCVKLHPYEAGIPDRMVLMPGGKIFFCELKSPTGRTRPIQDAYHAVLRKLGFDVYVLNNTQDIPELLDKYS